MKVAFNKINLVWRKRAIAATGIVGVMGVVLLTGRGYETWRANQQTLQAAAASHTAFNSVKSAYIAQDYEVSERVWLGNDGLPSSEKMSDRLTFKRRPDALLMPRIDAALTQLGRVNPDHLMGCDVRFYHIMDADLQDRLRKGRARDDKARQPRPEAQVRAAPVKTDGGDAKAEMFELARVIQTGSRNDMSAHSIAAVTTRLTGSPLSLEQLLELAATEQRVVDAELAQLEADIIAQGTAKSLDEFAAQPDLYAVTDNDILAAYEPLGALLRQSLQNRFYAYDVPPAKTVIVTKPHGMRARGAYMARDQRVILFHDRARFDLKSLGFLAVHEDFPGHHFDHELRPLAGVCPDEPARTFSVEAWSTYAEYLADDAGFFDDPVRRLGWLDYRLIRVARINMDARQLQGVTSKDALRDIWARALPPRLHDLFDQEYERVFTSKRRLKRFRHQHLGYLLGSHTIMATKSRLQAELGDEFDEKKFHHILLTGTNADVAVLYGMMKAGLAVPGDYPFDPLATDAVPLID